MSTRPTALRQRRRGGRALAPGARVRIRGEIWTVRSVRGTRRGGMAVQVVGSPESELVRGKEAIFLDELDAIEELRPEETALVADQSANYRRSRLYLEALLRRTPPTDAALHVGHRAAIEVKDYQLQPAAKALGAPRPRILMADGVGLGKTIEVGVLLSELIRRGRGTRILVVALKSILAQFQEELWARFTIPLVRLDSVGLKRVRSRIPSSMNPFFYFDRAIISIDTLKRDALYRRYLEQCHWDAVVIDECQNVAVRDGGVATGGSQRARLAQLLATTTDALVLTSATPHDGRARSFASLVSLLEPTAIADPEQYTADDVSDYFIRRFKKDVAAQSGDVFSERALKPVRLPANAAEDAVFAALEGVRFETIGRVRSGAGQVLFRTTLLKAYLSSPAACIETIDHRLAHASMQDESDGNVATDTATLQHLRALCEAVGADQFGKLRRLVSMLRDLGLDKKKSTERVVIFSERIATLALLKDTLLGEVGLDEKAVATFHGTLGDTEQTALIKRFGSESTRLRVLLCSDAASEGINLHHFCHRLVHFDLPWSLITLEQRNGRIDRFGQKHTPTIHYLLTVPGASGLAGDLRILDRLIDKEDAAHQNLGDAASLMHLYDADAEAQRVGRAIEQHELPLDVIPDAPPEFSFLDELLGQAGGEPPPQIATPRRLFASDLDYARDALDEVLDGTQHAKHVEWHAHLDGFTLQPPDDLARRYEYLPPELRTSETGGLPEIKLTADRQRVMDALAESRSDPDRWPAWQLWWEQHPVATWLDDRVLSQLGRHEAPVIRLTDGVAAGETIVLMQGVFSNKRGQPALCEWFGVRFEARRFAGIERLDGLLDRTRLGDRLANPGTALDAAEANRLSALLPDAVSRAEHYLGEQRQLRAAARGEQLRISLKRLGRWYDETTAALDAEENTRSAKRRLREDEVRRFDDRRRMFKRQRDERHEWVEQVLRTGETPFIRVAALLVAAVAR